MSLSRVAVFDATANGGLGQALTAASATPFQVEKDADFTIGCYFRLTQSASLASNVQPLFGQWQHLVNGWVLEVVPSSPPLLQVAFADGGTVTSYNCTGSGQVALDTDYLVIAEYDATAGTVSVRVNDVVDGSGAVSVPFNPTDAFFVGGDGLSGARQTGANLGIVFKYPGKLSTTLQTWLYNSGNFRSGAEILAETGLTTPDFLYAFNDNSSLVTDSGPNNLTLAPKNATGPTGSAFAPPEARPSAGTLTAGTPTGRSVPLTITGNTGGTGVYSNRAQFSLHGANSWTPTGPPVSGATATLNAVGLSPSTQYDLRVIVTDANSGTATSNLVTITTGATAGAPAGVTWGINLSSTPLGYDGSSLIFGDLFLSTASGWQGYSDPLRADGYPASVDFAGNGRYAWCTIGLNAHLPAGTYTIEVDGTGHYDILGNSIDGSGTWHGHDVPGGTNNTFTHVLSGQTDGTAPLQLRITQSSVGDPIRNIRLWLPGHVGTTFYQPFVDSIAPFGTLRFMDWLVTNGSTWVEFADRSSTMYSFSQRGYIDLSYAVELCNLTNKDMWLNLPGLMSDAGLQAMAEYVDANLESGRKLLVEFSNEVWNYGMPQWGQFSTKLGAGFSWEGIADLDAHSTSVFKSHVTSGRTCLVVIARQIEYDGTLTVAQQRYQLAGAQYDIIAGAPYFFTTADKGAQAALFATDPATAVTNVINGMVGVDGNDSAPTMKKGILDVIRWKGFADSAGVPLAFYEWGMGEGNYDDSIQPLMVAVNRDERMKTLIYDYFTSHMPDGIGPLCHYNDAGIWTKYGNWGALEYTLQASQTTPPAKYRALVAAASGTSAPTLVAGTVSSGSVTGTTAAVSIGGTSGGTAPYSNQLQVSPYQANTWTNNGSPVAGSSATLTATGLTAGSPYSLRVVVTDSASQSATSNAVTETTSGSAPALAAGTLATGSVSTTTASVTIATNSGGTSPYSNQLQVSAHGANSWTNAGSPVTGATATLTASGLTASTQYDFRVVVTDGASGTATSNVVSETTSAATATVSSVAVSPSTATVAGGASQSFAAVVSGTNSPGQSVTWTTTAGTINSSGTLTAPTATGSIQTATVRATSQVDNTKSGTATVTIPAAVSGGGTPSGFQLRLRYATPSLSTVYFVLVNSAGQAWNGTAFVAISAGSWPSLGLAAADPAGSGLYFAAIPSGIAAQSLTAFAFVKAGASPAPGDAPIEDKAGYWDGTSFGSITPDAVRSIVVALLPSIFTATGGILSGMVNGKVLADLWAFAIGRATVLAAPSPATQSVSYKNPDGTIARTVTFDAAGNRYTSS